jgi:hypothetical protein
MRAARTAPIVFLLALLVGCGGSKSDYEEVPGPPAGVSIPSDSSLDSSSGDASATATPSGTPTATATPSGTGSTGTSTGTGTATTDAGTGGTTDSSGTTGTSDSGGASAPGTEDSPTSDSPPPAGSDAQEFEDFCAQNPGAC